MGVRKRHCHEYSVRARVQMGGAVGGCHTPYPLRMKSQLVGLGPSSWAHRGVSSSSDSSAPSSEDSTSSVSFSARSMSASNTDCHRNGGGQVVVR